MLRFLGSVPSHFELIPCLFFLEGMIVQHIHVCIYIYTYILCIYGEPSNREHSEHHQNRSTYLVSSYNQSSKPATLHGNNISSPRKIRTSSSIHPSMSLLSRLEWPLHVFAPKILGVWLYIVPPVHLYAAGFSWTALGIDPFKEKNTYQSVTRTLLEVNQVFGIIFWIYFSGPQDAKKLVANKALKLGDSCDQSWGYVDSKVSIHRTPGAMVESKIARDLKQCACTWTNLTLQWRKTSHEIHTLGTCNTHQKYKEHICFMQNGSANMKNN